VYGHISGYVVVLWQVNGVCFSGSITLTFPLAKNIGCSVCIVILSTRIFAMPPDRFLPVLL